MCPFQSDYAMNKLTEVVVSRVLISFLLYVELRYTGDTSRRGVSSVERSSPGEGKWEKLFPCRFNVGRAWIIVQRILKGIIMFMCTVHLILACFISIILLLAQ